MLAAKPNLQIEAAKKLPMKVLANYMSFSFGGWGCLPLESKSQTICIHEYMHVHYLVFLPQACLPLCCHQILKFVCILLFK